VRSVLQILERAECDLSAQQATVRSARVVAASSFRRGRHGCKPFASHHALKFAGSAA
jgi:hypothetical protein